jgi:hypothetical protein
MPREGETVIDTLLLFPVQISINSHDAAKRQLLTQNARADENLILRHKETMSWRPNRKTSSLPSMD